MRPAAAERSTLKRCTACSTLAPLNRVSPLSDGRERRCYHCPRCDKLDCYDVTTDGRSSSLGPSSQQS